MPTANEVFRDFVVDGEVSSGKHNVKKEDSRTWGTGLETAIAAGVTKDEEQDDALETQQALIDGMIQAVITAQYPVGSLLFTSNASVPAAYAVGRTWVAYAQGRVPVGVGTADGVTYAGGQLRGSNTHVLTDAEMPEHGHGNGSLAVSVGSGGNDFSFTTRRGDSEGDSIVSESSGLTESSDSDAQTYEEGSGNRASDKWTYDGTHGHGASVSGSTASAGSGDAHNNIQPSIGVFIFRRTA